MYFTKECHRFHKVNNVIFGKPKILSRKLFVFNKFWPRCSNTMTIYILQQISKNRINAIKTCAFMLSFLALGLYESAVGPSLLDLKIAIDGTMADVVWILPAATAGYIIGAFLSRYVTQSVNTFNFTTIIRSFSWFPIIPTHKSVLM